LSWHIHYHLGADEKRGLAKFSELSAQARLRADLQTEILWPKPAAPPQAAPTLQDHAHPPSARNFEAGDFVSGCDHRNNRISQFVFASRRFLQARGKLEEATVLKR